MFWGFSDWAKSGHRAFQSQYTIKQSNTANHFTSPTALPTTSFLSNPPPEWYIQQAYIPAILISLQSRAVYHHLQVILINHQTYVLTSTLHRCAELHAVLVVCYLVHSICQMKMQATNSKVWHSGTKMAVAVFYAGWTAAGISSEKFSLASFQHRVESLHVGLKGLTQDSGYGGTKLHQSHPFCPTLSHSRMPLSHCNKPLCCLDLLPCSTSGLPLQLMVASTWTGAEMGPMLTGPDCIRCALWHVCCTQNWCSTGTRSSGLGS